MAGAPARSGAAFVGLALAAITLPVAGPVESRARAVRVRPPNVLLIVTDDQRWGMSAMPQTREIFRSGGTGFPHAFVTTPLCCPSRASILSGRYAHNHGVLKNSRKGGADNFDGRGALPDLLQRAGYHTGVIGKYLNAWGLRKKPPYFDEFLLTNDSTYYGGRWNRNGDVERRREYSTTVMAEAAEDFLTRRSVAGTPWFLQIATVAPHRPFTPEKRYRRARVRRWSPAAAHRPGASRGKPPFVTESTAAVSRARRVRRGQLRTLMSVDDLVERVFAHLELTLDAGNTLAFFLSDNGTMWGEYGLMGKGVPYTPSVKVPMMMRWPAGTDGRSIDRRLVTNVDIAATVLDATGAPLPRHPLDGRSLLDPSWRREHVLLEYWGNITQWRPWASLRTKRWQYIEHYDAATGARYFRELYDLRRDPWQVSNLLWQRQAPEELDLERTERLLHAYRTCRGTTGARACP